MFTIYIIPLKRNKLEHTPKRLITNYAQEN